MTLPINLDLINSPAVNPGQPTAPITGVYGDLFQPLFGTLTAENQQEVWVQFLTIYNLSDPPSPDADTQNLFLKYASDVYKLIQNLIVSQENFTIDIPLLNPPTTGFYGNAFESYFADKSPIEKQKIWAQFLLNNNFTIIAPPEDFITEKLFIDFASTILDKIHGQGVHSPEEVRKRYIMAITLDSLIEMLGSLQDTIGTSSRTLIFYGKWQQEYTKMMSRVPTYVGQPNSSVQVPPGVIDANSNFDKFTFGYNKISVSEIADWWAANSLRGDATQPFSMTSLAKDGFGQPIFTLNFNPQTTSSAGGFFWSSPFTGSGFVPIPVQPPATSFEATAAQSQIELAYEEYTKAFKTAFATAWTTPGTGIRDVLAVVNPANLNAINVLSAQIGQHPTAMQPRSTAPSYSSDNSSLELAWGFSYVVPSQLHSNTDGIITNAGSLSDLNAKLRAEKNADLQNVIENIRSRRKIVQNLAQALQTNLDQSRQTVTSQSDLLNSILQSMTDLVKAVFRRR